MQFSISLGKVKLAGIHNNQVNANLHKPQKIRCDFEGHEPIKVTWKKGDGREPLDKTRVKQEGMALVFLEIEKKDEGHYLCYGENTFSSAESYVNISVFGKGIIPCDFLWDRIIVEYSFHHCSISQTPSNPPLEM